MGDAKLYCWIAIGQIIGLVTMVGLRLKLDSADAVLLMVLGVLALCIFVVNGVGTILGVLARSITGVVVGVIAGWGFGMIPGIIAVQLTGNVNAMTVYVMVGVVAGVFVSLILNATANKGIDKTVDAIVAGITIGAIAGLIYFKTDYSYYSHIVSLIAGMTLGAVVSVIAGAFTGGILTKNIDGIVESTIVGAISIVSVGAVTYTFGRHDDLFMLNGILVGMIVGMIVGVNAAAIDNVYSRTLFRVFSGAFVGGIAGAVVSLIGFRITDAILCVAEACNTLVGTPLITIPLITILIFAIIGCILSILAYARQKHRETRHTAISSHMRAKD